MASTPTTSLLVQKQGASDNPGSWGDNLNVGLDVLDVAIAGSTSIDTTGGTTTLADSNYTADAAKSMVLDVTGTLASNATIIVPVRNKIYAVRNGTSGAYTLTIKTSTGTGVDIPQSSSAFVAVDATSDDVDFLTPPTTSTSGVTPITQGGTGATTAADARTNLGVAIGSDVQAYDSDLATWAGITPAAGVGTFLTTPSSANLAAAVTDETGSGALVFANTPTLVTPALGAATATSVSVGDDAYAAGWNGSTLVPTKNAVYDKIELVLGTTLPAAYQPLDADLTSWAGVTRASGFDTFAATPSLANLGSLLTDDATGLTTFMTTPSSANLASLLTDETGTGAAVFAGSPALTGTPTLAGATSGTIGLIATAIAGANTLTLPAATDTLVGKATTDTLTNKTVNLTSNTLTGTAAQFDTACSDGQFLYEADIGSTVQAYDADLTTWAGVTPAAGIGTFLATPTSANLISAMTDETGTGALVFANTPTLVTPILGTPTSVTLTNATGLPSIVVANEAADTTCFPAFFTAATGELGPKTNTGLTYNSSTNNLTATTFTGALSGNATTATSATTATTATNITVSAEGVDTTMSVLLAGSATGNQGALTNTSLTYNATAGSLAATSFVGALTGNADTVTWANEAADTTCFIGFATAASGSLAPKTNTNLTFNASTGVLTSASAVLTTADINGGTVDGAVIGGASAAAGTFTTATVGNTGLVVGASTPFSDAAGVLTLQNVDALDATTEVTIEAAIDTLANLTSIQGRTVTLADAGVNAIFGWDDTAGAYENLSAAEATATLNVFGADAGAGGVKGLAPATVAGDSLKFLKGDGTWSSIPGGGDALVANPLSQFAATTSLQFKGVISDETGAGAVVFAEGPTFSSTVAATATDTHTNTNDAASVLTGIFQGDRATMAANDAAYIDLRLSDSAGNQDPFARLKWQGTTVTSTSEVGKLLFGIGAGGTIADEVEITATAMSPVTNDGNALGTTALGWADLYLASGGTLHFANTDWVATHTTGILTVGTGDFRVTTAGTNTASVVTVGGTQTLTAKTLTSPTIGTSPTAAGATWTDLGTVTTGTFANTGLRVLDTNASHSVIFAPGSNITANRTITINTGDANRTVDLGAWTSYTPTITAGSGSFTTVSATGSYAVVGTICFVQIEVTITTNGTAGGSVIATIPFTSAASCVWATREDAATGVLGQARMLGSGSTDISFFTSANGYPGGTGYVLKTSGFYRI